MSETRLSPDQKGQASLNFSQVILDTQHLHPDSRFHGSLIKDMGVYKIGALKPHYPIWVTTDGIGTKPELAERLATETGDSKYYESLAYDTFAMIDGDVARFGFVLAGIAHVLDYNKANQEVVSALARGTKKACIEGRFALLNGETAELGYRTSGFGESRLNWNAFGVYAINKRRLLLGEKLEADQPIIAIREKGIRSNGLTRAREILETGHLLSKGYTRKEDYVADQLGGIFGSSAKKALGYDTSMTFSSLDNLMGHPFLEQVQIPWHRTYPEITEQLLTPSILYGRLMYEAQGGIDKKR